MEQQETATALAIKWPRWLNLKEASKYSGVAIGTFKRHLVETGKVHANVTDFGKRYDRDEIDQAISNWY